MVVTNDKKIKKMCSFYASDFHLEMIILPYIAEKIKENKKIKVITENSLKESMKILLSKMNIKDKNDILQINWENNYLDEITDDTVFIINGSEPYIKDKNKQIEKSNKNKIEIVNCFKFEEVRDRMDDIIKQHTKVINNLKQ